MELNLTLRDLRDLAKSLGMRNYFHLKKHELIRALELYFTIQERKPSMSERQRANAMERYYKGIYE